MTKRSKLAPALMILILCLCVPWSGARAGEPSMTAGTSSVKATNPHDTSFTMAELTDRAGDPKAVTPDTPPADDTDIADVQAGTALARVEPVTSTVMAGQTLTVTITISDVVDLNAFEFKMAYDPAVVHVEDVALGPFLGSTGRSASPLGPNIDNEGGTMSFGAWTLGSEPGPEGSGVLAEITLTAQGPGVTSLDLYDVQIVDAETETVTVEDGEVRVGIRFYVPLVVWEW